MGDGVRARAPAAPVNAAKSETARAMTSTTLRDLVCGMKTSPFLGRCVPGTFVPPDAIATGSTRVLRSGDALGLDRFATSRRRHIQAAAATAPAARPMNHNRSPIACAPRLPRWVRAALSPPTRC